MSDKDYMLLVRKHRNQHSFQDLSNIKVGHKKVKDIPQVSTGGAQKYMKRSKFTNKTRRLLYNLRCKSVKLVKDNFQSQFKEDPSCPF